MRYPARVLATVLLVLLAPVGMAHLAIAQSERLDRVPFNGQELWLSGGNVAWVNFARDIGPGTTDLDTFEEIFRQVQANGGNAMRLWLHTTGEVSPAWEGNRVTGPGAGTIEDLEAILDLAWQYEVGVMLCLWSFDMLRRSNGTAITDRAYALLTDSSLTQQYIDNALLPMVDALADHPAALAWEIFNEPEGMSEEFGWSFNRHVPMADIQRFVNQTAGAIHRAAPDASVTNGTWSFYALWDRPPAKASQPMPALTAARVEQVRQVLTDKYDHPFTVREVQAYLQKVQSAVQMNYYTDERLVAAGGDPDGTLDYYTVHYYEWAGTALSPFHHDVGYWGLDKSLVVAEFYMGEGDDGDPDRVYGIPYDQLYETLYTRGYAGALAWQWYNYPVSAEGVVNWPRMLAAMETMRARYPGAVQVDAGLRISSFLATPDGVEEGGQSTLSWFVGGAEQITLDGLVVDSVGTQVVTPDSTTTYTLLAYERGGEQVDTARVTVTVLDPDEVNRALGQPTVASTVETCCGDPQPANLATDGDPSTRWSSEWEEGLADADPDDEWLQVDLGQAFRIDRVVLDWETAYGRAYALQVSYDAQVWTTVYEETAGDGGRDEVVFDDAPSGRYVRMQGIERATTFGYSLWELAVYGLPSSQQPPTVALTRPSEGGVLRPDTEALVVATAEDPDGTVRSVEFYIDDTLLGTATEAPFTTSWSVPSEGVYRLRAVATDNDGIAVASPALPVYIVDTRPFTRYEAESGTFSGLITAEFSPAASARGYLDLRDNGTITFDVEVPERGRYTVALGYNLAYDVPKQQSLRVNDQEPIDVWFTGPLNSWQERAIEVPLEAGLNTITMELVWGWMYLDYLSVSGGVVNVATESPEEPSLVVNLEANYPNPFNGSTTVAYTLPAPGPVQLEVFDLLGRSVATLVEGLQSAGRHTVRFDGKEHAGGLYMVRLQANGVTRTHTMLLLR